MFKIFSFKQISILTIIICFFLLSGAVISTLTPVFCDAKNPSVCVPIVMYHQITENEDILGDYAIPLSVLKDDFEYFKENDIIPISFKQLRAFTERGEPLPKKSVCITFDDGQKTFLTKVLPLLEEYNYPANVNVVGALTELYTINKDNDDRYAYLNEADIKALSKNPLVEIGCHTYNLHSLSNRRGAARLETETASQYRLFINNDLDKFHNLYFRITSDVPIIFAYPYGIRNDLLEELVKEKGYKITLSCRESVNTLQQGSSLYELGRFNRPYGISTQAFFDKIF